MSTEELIKPEDDELSNLEEYKDWLGTQSKYNGLRTQNYVIIASMAVNKDDNVGDKVRFHYNIGFFQLQQFSPIFLAFWTQ